MNTYATNLAIALLGISCRFLSAQPERPTYEVVKTPTPVQVDGRLDDAVWQQASSVSDFRNNVDGSASPYDTEAKILYDDQFIYFAFRCVDDNIWSTFAERDQHLWTEEVVEVFIQADAGHPSYIELEVNPLGTMLDIFLIDVRKPIPYSSWNSDGLKWAVQMEGSVDGQSGDTEWTCEMALPLKDMVTAPHIPPQPGDRWRLNLYRVEKRPAHAGLAWSPTFKPDFHVPGMFGEIVFAD